MANQIKSLPYTAKRFADLKQSLLTFAKTYFPETHTDFSDESVGMMFLEMFAATGDVLGFYQDTQHQETLLTEASELKNMYTLAYQYGYKPQPTRLSTVPLDIYQTVPARNSFGNIVPDYNYALRIKPGMQLRSDSSIDFYVEDGINFSTSSATDPTEIIISNRVNGVITEYQFKKRVLAVSGEKRVQTFVINNAKPYFKLELVDNDIASIISITDSEGNDWYEVDYMAQDQVIRQIPNDYTFSSDFTSYVIDTPFLVDWQWIPRRFTTRFKDPTKLIIGFGSGTSEGDTSKLPNLDKFGLDTIEGNQMVGLDPTIFLRSNAYGLVPQNTTLTVTYLAGGGVKSNIKANELSTIVSADISVLNAIDPTKTQAAIDSFALINPEPASGGRSGDTVEEIREIAGGSYGSQLRAVTKDDYRVRVLAMEPKFGSVARCFVKSESDSKNAYIALYVLGLDSTGAFTSVNRATKYNINRYLEPYKLVTDNVVIRDAFPVNIEVFYQVMILPGFSGVDILKSCDDFISSYFEKGKWDINQSIKTSDLFVGLSQLKGVQSISNISIKNKNGSGYSDYQYDIESATRNGIIYCSIDPMIFELRFPQNDIHGKVINY